MIAVLGRQACRATAPAGGRSIDALVAAICGCRTSISTTATSCATRDQSASCMPGREGVRPRDVDDVGGAAER